MNRIRLLAIGSVLIFTLSNIAQQPAPGADPRGAAPSAEQHLNVLSEKLGLTADQKEKARPIMQKFHDGMQAIMEDQSISGDERTSKAKALFDDSDAKLRVYLNEGQKKKLTEMEQQMHNGRQGDGKLPPPPPQS